jgi:hypothetical protein
MLAYPILLIACYTGPPHTMKNFFPRLLFTCLLTLSFLNPLSAVAGENEALAERAFDITEKRCMVCHGCYDAPCQLKLEARAGLDRGASKALVYDGARLRTADMTRLFDDAITQRQWRKKGFFPMVDDKDPSAGVMYRMLELKEAHPLPASGPMPQGFDFSLNRDQQCPKPDEFEQFATDYPLWGMPYGLPGLNSDEHSAILKWLEQGAPAVPLPPLRKSLQKAVNDWESFLNADSSKEQLVARYLYEHLFLANIYFETNEQMVWFRMVRSTTPPGQEISVIPSRRPFDDPGTDTFYYRIQLMPLTPLLKIHMPYRLDAARMARYRELFLEPEYAVAELPGYDPVLAANPFKTFMAIPAKSRYQYLLDEAQFTLMNFIKGPVCRGSIALNVIEDRFWVMFAEPDVVDAAYDEEFLASEADNLRMPTVRTGTPIDLLAWRKYAKGEQAYQQARAKYMMERLSDNEREFNEGAIWDGDGHNPNAALTIFRHFDSATVVKGFVGDVPKTAWVISYPLLERIYYLLAANFDVFGPVSHQFESRLYMDFLRMEGESNFIIFMPDDTKKELWAHWYRDAPRSVNKHLADRERWEVSVPEAEFAYETDDPKTELLLEMKHRIYGAKAHQWDYQSTASATTRKAVDKLQANVGAHNSFMPDVTYINVIGEETDEVYSIIRDSGYSNIAQLFKESERRLPAEDALTIVPGFLGAYPNYFLMVNENDLDVFAETVAGLDNKAKYDQLLERWGVHRTDPWFWRVSDKFHKKLEKDPINNGLLDYNRYHAR